MSETRHRTYHLLGSLIEFHAFPDETGGGCGIVEILTAPGTGAPPHKHPGEDENFFVLDGQFEFDLDGKKLDVGAGDFVKIPDGRVHAFKCVGDKPGRLLNVTSPGTMHEAFFTKAGDPVPEGTVEFPAADGPPDLDRIMTIADRIGLTILRPEGSAQ